MDLKTLRYLVEVADTGSFSRAAAALHLTQPTLSRQIALLEEELGQRLLLRTGRGVAPTEAGDAMLVHARAMLDTAKRARDEMRELHASPGGRIAVGLPPRIALGLTGPLVKRFRERFPRAVITVAEGLSLHLREGLIAGRLDLALLFDPPSSPQLQLSTLRRESLWLVAPPRARGARKLPPHVGLKALADYPMVLPGAPNAIRSLIDAALRPQHVELQVLAEVSAVQTLLSLVTQGLACTILPASSLALAPADAGLQRATIGPPAIRNTLVLAVPQARPSTRLSRETAQLLRELAPKADTRAR